MNITIVTEKGTVAQAIAAAILEGQPVRRHDHIAGVIGADEVRIIWPDGHALDLAPPEHYKPEWGRSLDRGRAADRSAWLSLRARSHQTSICAACEGAVGRIGYRGECV